MRFALDDEQRMFGQALRARLSAAGTAGAVRAWAAGDHGPGRALWSELGEAGVFAVAVEEDRGGAGMLPVELVVAMAEVGRHAVPGPVVETVVAGTLLDDADRTAALVEGALMVSLAHPPVVPHALDADTADLVLALRDGHLHGAVAEKALPPSFDPARRLFGWSEGERVPAREPGAHAADLGALACAAQALGLGEHLLAATVEYVCAREQFGRPVGEYQALKHRLADTHTALEFARPLVFGAALAHGTPEFGRDVSAAKVAASEAAQGAAGTALQLHGAIGYTDEFDLSLWIRKARALRSAWGDPAHHRARVAEALRA
ncbi:acyl-CoA dehydrogenase family protein [Nocardiopsis sp. HNM0947]|uniref:Acyl-CoA dehydrogenase family protein n=1 Tax=Nocardiopsis coralli TaxID=2772213 RepID=A0ABR9PBI8_9ACTN|nr:acyl-CoA dehydrogenase family protein [Nocardiopsis coralli]MBE3001207.1 acyl-CoA dehydrogenase family protein [Nocardiopsis coralli]